MSNNRFKPKKTKSKKEKKEKSNIPTFYESGNAAGNFSRNSPIKKVHKNRKF